MFHEDEFEAGEMVTCIHTDGYRLTKGRTYEVLYYEPRSIDENLPGFTWPAYVTFADDAGEVVVAHVNRFRKESQQQESQNEQ